MVRLLVTALLLGGPARAAGPDGRTFVSGGPGVAWFAEKGPRFGGIDAELARPIDGRLIGVMGFSTIPFSFIPGLALAVGSRFAVRGGVDLRLGPRGVDTGPLLGFRLGGQNARPPRVSRAEPRELSAAADLRLGWRFALPSGALLTLGAGLRARAGTWSWSWDTLEEGPPAAIEGPRLLPAGELSLGRRF